VAVLVVLAVLVGLVVAAVQDGGGAAATTGRRWEGRPRLFLFFLAGGGAALVLVTYRLVTRPVGALLGAAERVKAGDYGARVVPSGPKELRALTATFNEMAEGLGSADEQRRLLLAEVSHELRTPLAVLQGGLEAQLDGVQPRDDPHLQSLLEEAQQLGRLIDDLHTVALADAGQLVLHPQRCQPQVLVEEAVAGHVALAERRGIGLTAAPAPGLPDIEADPTRVRQVLANLVANAVRHADDGGAVVVSASREPGTVRFVVTDDGPGIPPEQLPYVFERFTRSADSRGSGIGLSLARDLVEAHGGAITATSGPGGGTEVAFTLPAPAGA
jgi:signal transduction histidine kinase